MKNKICCIFNAAPHYREPIYTLMDQELKCDFYIGSKLLSPLNLMSYNKLNGFKKELKNIYLISYFNWQKGALLLIFKPYKKYIITGEPHCLSTWLILIFGRILGKQTYLWTHGWYGNEKPLKKIIKLSFFNLSNKILLYGDYAKEMMIKVGFSPQKLIPIYNSMDYNSQLKIRKGLMLTNVYKNIFQNINPTLIYVGRIQHSKKIDLLLKAIKILQKPETYCNLFIVGSDIENINIPKLILEKELQASVFYFGPCYDETKLGEFFFNSNLCVVPGDIGLTSIHSFTYGTPVLTHNNFSKHGPEFEAIIPDLNGSFFEEDSLDDLCNKITFWLNLNPEKRLEVRKNCYRIVEEKYNPFRQIEILKDNLQ